MNYRELFDVSRGIGREKQIFHGLDTLRGVAAIAVLMLHASALLRAPWLMQSGFLAVDLFFTISGFVIAHSYDEQILTKGFGEFIRVRLIRLYPLYLLGLSLGLLHAALLLALGHQAFSVGDILAALGAGMLFLPAPVSALSVTPFGSIRIAPLDAPAWSLIYEFWINVIYAALILLMRPPVLAAITAVAAIGLISTTAAFGWEAQIVNLCRVGFSFSAGVLLHRTLERMPDMGWAWPALPWIATLAFLAPASDLYSLFFTLAISPALVWAGSQARLKPAGSTYFAAISYCVYAIHFPILELTSGAINHLGLPSAPMTAIVIIGILCASWLLDKYFDRPIRDFLKRKIRLRQAIDVREER